MLEDQCATFLGEHAGLSEEGQLIYPSNIVSKYGFYLSFLSVGYFDRPFIFYPTLLSLEIIIMKAAQIFGQLSSSANNKYIPTP